MLWTTEKFWDKLLEILRKKGGKTMCNNSYSCRGTGAFLMGAVAGMAAGAALTATMTPSSTRQIKRAAHKAAKRVNEAVDHLADAMDM